MRLTNFEVFLSATVGVRRFIKSRNFDKSKQHLKDFSWHNDIEAAGAEMAVAKLLGVYWDGSVNTFKLPDVGGIYQVRHTLNPKGCLIVRDRDSPDEIYIFARGSSPTYEILGWMKGSDAMQPEFERNPNNVEPAWFVPADKLHQMSEIPRKNNEL